MTERLILDPTQPEVQNHQTLVSDVATNSKIISACKHYGIPCDRENMALARLRLAVLFAGAAPPQGEPKWLTDLLPLFERQAWKSHPSIKEWARTYFGEQWEPAHTIAFSISRAVEMMLESNNIAFDYRGPERAPKPERTTEPPAELPAKPQFNIVNCFSELLRRDLSEHPVMGMEKYRERYKTDWIEANYTAPALAALGLRAGDTLYAQEEGRLRTAFRPSMVERRNFVWIAQQLDFARVKVSGRGRTADSARLLPWNIVIARAKVSPPIDLLVAFTVSRSISLAALSDKSRSHESAPAPSQPGRGATQGDDGDGGDDDEDKQPAAPRTLHDAFLNTYQVRQLLNDPDPSKSRPGVSTSRAKKSPHEVKTLLAGPRTTAFANFVQKRCTGYSTRYPLGLRYQRDGGPPFDPNEYAGRPHPAVSPDLCFIQRKEEKEKLQRALPAPE